jgi:hypothetical protein
MASRCFYCGADAQSPAAKPAGAFTPVSSPALVPAAVPAAAAPAPVAPAAPAAPRDPNTHCPICKNAIVAAESAAFTCPACQSRLECLFASAKALQGSTATRPGLSELCINHPANQAVARCRICRKAVCDTCLFRGPTGSYCPDCAVKPDEASQRSTTGLGIASLACGFLSLGSLAGIFFLALSSHGNKDSAAAAGCFSIAAFVLCLAGIITGFVSRDAARKRSPVGLAGLIVNFLVLGIYGLLFLLAMRGKG